MKNRIANKYGVPIIASLALLSTTSHADNLKLESSVVLVDAGKGEASLGVLNNDKGPLLMVTRLEKIPEEPVQRLTVTPPVARVEPGDTQVVRFFLVSKDDIKVEHLERVSFEGVPPKDDNSVHISIRQNIPVIIRPKNLARNDEPWKLLTWARNASGFSVKNHGPYVVRMAQAATLLPSKTAVALPRTYILPGETLDIKTKAPSASDTDIEISPASLYGYIVGKYPAKIGSSTADAATASTGAASATATSNPQ
ncbi:fimbria/pilus chaperone family protein [Burkholderia sp. ABCPW 11]|uniref:fimbria/pilus chaperone family protein n=1 Tax=Burkholderia sp. ABCPW 11 TaxID=1637859 RepID=UPI000AA91FEF|nr:fimbria/pilus chaperone family protein [Burkholderia sp. ABCPW 11]